MENNSDNQVQSQNTPPIQHSQDVQPQTTSATQPSVPQVQTFQQPAVQTQPPNQVAPITTTPPQVNSNQKVARKTLIIYFLVGLLTHFFGLILGGLWIALKVKENKKPRFLSLLAGLVTAIIVGVLFNLFVTPKLQSTIVNKYPELAYIPNELVKDYPNAKFGVDFQTTKYLTGEKDGATNSTLTVSVFTDQLISAEDRKIIGGKVCTLLENNNDSYDSVVISQVNRKRLLFFHYDQSLSEARTCQEWREGLPPGTHPPKSTTSPTIQEERLISLEEIKALMPGIVWEQTYSTSMELFENNELEVSSQEITGTRLVSTQSKMSYNDYFGEINKRLTSLGWILSVDADGPTGGVVGYLKEVGGKKYYIVFNSRSCLNEDWDCRDVEYGNSITTVFYSDEFE